MKKLLIAIIGLLFCAQAVFALTRSEIRYQIRYDIRDTTDTVNINNLFSDDIINSRINIVQDEIVEYTKCLQGRCLITPIAETAECRMPSDLIAIDRVSYINTSGSTTTYRRLIGRHMFGLDEDYPAWESATSGLPREYYIRRNFIGLYPKPSSTYAQTKSFKLDYYKKADELDEDTDEPFDGDYSLIQYHKLIIKGVVIMCKSTMGQDYTVDKAEYIADLERMKTNVKLFYDVQENIKIK